MTMKALASSCIHTMPGAMLPYCILTAAPKLRQDITRSVTEAITTITRQAFIISTADTMIPQSADSLMQTVT